MHWLESVQGLPSAAALAELVAPFAAREAFICGPGPFMAAAEEALKSSGAAAERIHIEVFKSLESDPFAAVVIEERRQRRGPRHRGRDARRETHEVDLAAQGQAARRAAGQGTGRAVLLPRRTLRRMRGRCKKSGEVEMEINDVLEQQDLDEGLILACQAHPRSDSVEVTYDE